MSIIISSHLRLFYFYIILYYPKWSIRYNYFVSQRVTTIGKDHQSGRLVPFWAVYYDKSLGFGREAISKVSVEFGCSRDWKKWNSISECWSDEFQGKTKSTQVGHSCLTQRCDQDLWKYVRHVKHRGIFTYPLSLGLTR